MVPRAYIRVYLKRSNGLCAPDHSLPRIPRGVSDGTFAEPILGATKGSVQAPRGSR